MPEFEEMAAVCQQKFLELRPGLGHAYPDDYTHSLEKGLAFVLQE